MSDIILPQDWIPARSRFAPPKIQPTPIDQEVSKIVGKEIKVNDPRLINLIVKWKKEANKPDSDLSRDDYLYDAKKVKELKDAFV